MGTRANPLSRAAVTIPVVLVVIVVAIVLAYVLRSGGADPDDPADEPETAATNRAMAAMLIDRIDRDPTSQGDNYALEDYPDGSVGAIVNFDSDVLSLSGVATRELEVFERDRCDRPRSVMDGCREERLDDGSTLRIRWQELAPEEDPGIVHLDVRRDDQVVALSMTGPEITGDPAALDGLPVDFDDLVGVVTDPAFGMRTSQRYVDEGEQLDDWTSYE